jgi:UDP-N-acetylglucosamine 2-epimerase (non-hydrolysing)
VKPCLVVGTRPEIIKAAPLLDAFQGPDRFRLVHSGQHYDEQLSGVFLEELGLPSPERYLAVGSGTRDHQLSAVATRTVAAARDLDADCIFAIGDTNTVLGALRGAREAGLPAVHVEAGLRSYDERMVEEANRREADHLSQVLFAPTAFNEATLRGEGVKGVVRVVGNTVIDAVRRHLGEAERRSDAPSRVPWSEFALATFHRAENVDDPDILRAFVEVVVRSPVPVVLPLHPRTRRRLQAYGLEGALAGSPSVAILPPASYFDTLALLKRCAFVLTDSGGLQEEATAPSIRKKVLVMRRSTERQEAVRAGFVEVVGLNASAVLDRVRGFRADSWDPPKESPYGDGHAAERIYRETASLLGSPSAPRRLLP